MDRSFVAIVFALMLLFVNTHGVRLANAGIGNHAVEVYDLDCLSEVMKNTVQDVDTSTAPVDHVRHHNCAVAVPYHTTKTTVSVIPTDVFFVNLTNQSLVSHQSDPPNRPPSA